MTWSTQRCSARCRECSCVMYNDMYNSRQHQLWVLSDRRPNGLLLSRWVSIVDDWHDSVHVMMMMMMMMCRWEIDTALCVMQLTLLRATLVYVDGTHRTSWLWGGGQCASRLVLVSTHTHTHTHISLNQFTHCACRTITTLILTTSTPSMESLVDVACNLQLSFFFFLPSVIHPEAADDGAGWWMTSILLCCAPTPLPFAYTNPFL